MRFVFEPELDYQKAAIEAVCDLFRGQEVNRTEFTVTRISADGTQGALGLEESELGIGNRLNLLDDEILKNLRDVQLRNALAPAEKLAGGDFTVEMETGTGKTYVYLRTIFELNRRYGFTKFVIVVPSVAIREGVAKTLEMTADHFRALYAGAPMDWFVYDSAKLGQVRDFATSASIKIMVGTIGSFNKLDVNTFHNTNEKTGGWKPVDLVRATRPIIIVDEPQSVDGGENGAGRKALAEMHPLCTLRYSATHANKHHMVYRLDAIDAYERRLVKRIDVAGAVVSNAHNAPYVKLLGVTATKKEISATVEIDVQQAGQVARVARKVYDGDDLRDLTGRDVYAGFSIGDLEGGKGRPQRMELKLPGDVKWMSPGEAHGDVGRDGLVRQMIARTIREHFTREKALKPMGIKVLSLFFIDRVDAYRVHHEDGTTALGPYGRMFEEEYRRLAAHPDFTSLFTGKPAEPETAHNGYFSMDKKGRATEPTLNAKGEFSNNTAREEAERAFRLIMRDKEKLLDEAEPLGFIFSHSALREGWDNPNVFQICTLREMGTNRERRQTIGRGLRLCVDKHGQRRRDEGLNVLTVIAEEGYAAFAKGLQIEIEEQLGITFGVVAEDAFAAMMFAQDDGETTPVGTADSRLLFAHLRAAGMIDANGKVQDALREALKAGTLALPERFAAVATEVRALLTRLAGKLDIRNADERQKVALNKRVYLSDDFRELWDRIKHKTTYALDFDNAALVAAATKKLADAPRVPRAQLQWRKAGITIGQSGVDTENETASDFVSIAPEGLPLPDILSELQDRTRLTRASLAKILVDSGRLGDFKLNPSAFIDQAADLIGRAMRAAVVDGVKYRRIGDDAYYAQELFETEELTGYLNRMVPATRCVHDAVVFDSSTVEQPFAQDLEANEAVKLFAKLPSWFKVPTPLGSYNPDWAVLVNTGAGERVYFVVETKGSLLSDDLRAVENAKIECGKRHFKAIQRQEGEPTYIQARNLADVLGSVA